MESVILLFSSGLDSFILKHLYCIPDERCLFVDMGTKENKIEKKVISTYFPSVHQIQFQLSEFELPNKIIPFRNSFLALLAAQYGNTIYFAFTAGDTTKDKDYVFKSQMEGVFNYFALDTHKVHVQSPYTIQMPLKNKTKTELVHEYLGTGHSLTDLLTKSVSCYVGLDKPCGECRSCLRKYVALCLNGVQDPCLNPSIEVLKDFLEESIVKNRNHEINEIKTCIQQRQQ